MHVMTLRFGLGSTPTPWDCKCGVSAHRDHFDYWRSGGFLRVARFCDFLSARSVRSSIRYWRIDSGWADPQF